MSWIKSLTILAAIGLSLGSNSAFAAGEDESNGAPSATNGNASNTNSVNSVINALDYPELQVVPRASERLRMEGKTENSSWFVSHWPTELSGLATLSLALVAKGQYRDGLSVNDKNNADTVTTVSQAVGAGWLVAGVLIGLQRPYRTGLENISNIKGKDERSLLLRERLAEEALEKPARVMRPLKLASVLSNFALCALTGIYLTDQGRIIAGAAAVLAFLPVMYEDQAIDVYDKHNEYKKKIYRPMSSLDLHFDREYRATPMAKLSWVF